MHTEAIVKKLRSLAHNLYWAWHPDIVVVFRDLDPDLWRDVNHNPLEFLSRLAEKVIQEKAHGQAIENRLTKALRRLEHYLQAEDAWGTWHAGILRHRPVAYFCTEFGLHESLPIYSGGLGVLAGDHLKAASDLAIPMVGVGLFYAEGYFEQRIDASGWQEEHYRRGDLPPMPFEPLDDDQGRRIRVSVRTEGYDIWIEAWTTRVGRNRLVLLDTNVDGNSERDRRLTAALYGGGSKLRIRQELVLGIGGMRVLEAMNVRPSVVHLNEGHAAFAVLELTRQLMDRDGQSFDNMKPQAAGMTVFTTHTPVEAGHDRFSPELLLTTLAPVQKQLGLSDRKLLALGRVDPHDANETFCMTVLGLRMSRARNAVSALHGRVTRATWAKLWPNLPAESTPIAHITNGVHIETWMSHSLSELFNRELGLGWQDRVVDPRLWAQIDGIDDVDLWEIDEAQRAHLIEYVRRSLRRQAQQRGENEEIQDQAGQSLNPSTLTIGFARRFADYKRAYLMLQDRAWLEWNLNSAKPIQFIIAGKAHPRDHAAKEVLQKVFQATRDPAFMGKIVFLENYNMNVTRHMVQGVDLWLNIPRRPLEACGTSGQKVAINGGMNISTLDGWWAEAYDGTNGFVIGHGSEHKNWEHQDHMDAQSMRDTIEHIAVPAFYERDEEGIPRRWIAMQKRALRTLSCRFNARRMLLDYALGCYLPAAGGLTSPVQLGQEAHTAWRQPSAPKLTQQQLVQ